MQSNKRKTAIRKARELLLVNPVFLDTETTGLGPDDEIIEIAIVDKQGNTLFESLVKPNKRISVDAYLVHGITNDMVQNAPKWPEVWKQVSNVVSSRYAGIYNAEFDLRMIRQTHALNGLQLDGFINNFCIMKLYADFYIYGGGRYQKLEDAGRQCGLSLPNSHRAKDDTILALAVFNCIAGSKS